MGFWIDGCRTRVSRVQVIPPNRLDCPFTKDVKAHPNRLANSKPAMKWVQIAAFSAKLLVSFEFLGIGEE